MTVSVDWILIQVLAVLFVATLIRSAFGFGEALVAVPLLALFIPMAIAVPLVILISITVATVVLLQDWRQVQVRAAAHLVCWTLLGVPFGLFLLTTLADQVVKVALALLLIAFSSYCLIGRAGVQLADDRFAWVFGFAAGVLGGAYGMNGPPLVIYGALRHWPPHEFRATLQGYFLPASIAAFCGCCLAGLQVPIVARYYLLSFPFLVAAILLGHKIHERMKGRSFLPSLHVALIVIGVCVLVHALCC